MIGQRERKIIRKKRIITFFIVVACLAAAFVDPIRDKITNLFTPALRLIGNAAAELRKREALKHDIQEANEEIDRLHTLANGLIFDRTEYERLKRENMQLRQMVRYEAPEKFRMVPCGIIAFDVAMERRLMSLDCGSEHGIREGNAVLAPNGILLGTITKSGTRNSVTQLLKDPLSKVAGEVTGQSDAQGIVMPVGGGAVALRYLGENVKVEPSTIVQTSGLLDQVPAGIPIGTIDTTVKESDTPFQRAIIQTPIDPVTLTLVNVIVSL